MNELRKLLKAREKLVAQQEWALAGVKFYESVQLTAQVSIRDIDQAVEKIQEEAHRGAEIEKTVRAAKHATAPAKKARISEGDLPATSEGFWLGFLDQDGRRLAEVFDDALAALKEVHKFIPTPDQRRKLRNRLSVTFFGAAQNKVILSAGRGRDRLYRMPKRKISGRSARKPA